MMALLSRVVLLCTAFQCTVALRKRGTEIADGEEAGDTQECALHSEVEMNWVSDIPELDNVTFADHQPPFLITYWAPWCGWSRRFVTNGDEEAPIEQVSRELQASGGPVVLKYNTGGRDAPRVPRPPGFDSRYIPSVYLVAADGSQTLYEGDPADVQKLADFAQGRGQPAVATGEAPAAEQGCMDEEGAEPMFVSEIPEIDDATYTAQTPPFLITFWAPWCGWSRRFVTDGGQDASIEQVSRGLEAINGPPMLKYNVGGRDAPRVPLPPGFSIRGIPTIFRVSADGTKEAYQGSRDDVDALIAFATA